MIHIVKLIKMVNTVCTARITKYKLPVQEAACTASHIFLLVIIHYAQQQEGYVTNVLMQELIST